MSIHDQTRSATVALPFPSGKDGRRAHLQTLLKGEPSGDSVSGEEILENLDMLGRDFGTIRPAWGYSDDIVFFKKEDGSVGYEQVYSSSLYPATFVRKVIAHAVTMSKHFPCECAETFKSLEEVIKTLAEQGTDQPKS